MAFADRIAHGVKASFAARLVKIGTNALLLVLLTRYLFTTDQYGLLYTVISVVGVASMFATLGLPSSAARYVAEYSESDPSQVPRILKVSVLFVLGFGLLSSSSASASGGRWRAICSASSCRSPSAATCCTRGFIRRFRRPTRPRRASSGGFSNTASP